MLKSARVRVDVENGAVILSWTLLIYDHKMKYERIAWQTYGVVEADNEVLGAYRRQHIVEVAARVTSGKVLLQVAFAHPRAVFFLKHEVAEIEGVIAIEIHISFVV
ncbi:MAG: hypothetical protein GY847_07920 [Proteobacteria bacterium]|nr:hypothetical protein [Pseudomonadota bacterium]